MPKQNPFETYMRTTFVVISYYELSKNDSLQKAVFIKDQKDGEACGDSVTIFKVTRTQDRYELTQVPNKAIEEAREKNERASQAAEEWHRIIGI